MKGRWALYCEVTADHEFKEQSVEEELLTLWTLDVKLADDLRTLFEEAATDSLANVLGMSGARALAMRMGATTFESPRKVSEALDSIFREGSEILKDAIDEEFRASVHLLWEKMKRNSAQDSRRLVAPMARRPTMTRH